jgi:phosphatidylglycerophosphate synthase
MRPPSPQPTTAPRRVLATRNARWVVALASWLGRIGVRPNAVSIAGVVFALVAAVALGRTSAVGPSVHVVLLLVAAVGIQLRLLCNLIDGMLAVEGGFKTKTGDLYNDLPDRIADVIILVGAGYAVRALPYGLTLGWSAAVLAVFTAYVRVLGGALRLEQHFVGPMAKQHRMFTLTLASLLSTVEAVANLPPRVMYGGLVLIVTGSIITAIRRIRRLARELEWR